MSALSTIESNLKSFGIKYDKHKVWTLLSESKPTRQIWCISVWNNENYPDMRYFELDGKTFKG